MLDVNYIFTVGKSVQAKPEVDEFGRDKSVYMEQAKQRRAVEREARRSRRKKDREAAALKEENSKQFHEGFSSDDEERSGEILRFKNESGMSMTVWCFSQYTISRQPEHHWLFGK